jgi:hypothetical protein
MFLDTHDSHPYNPAIMSQGQYLRGGVLIGRIRLRQQGSNDIILPDFCPAGKNLEEYRWKNTAANEPCGAVA